MTTRSWLRAPLLLTLTGSLLVLSGAVASAHPGSVQGSQATLTVIKGAVTIDKAGASGTHRGVDGETLGQGDMVSTASDGAAMVTFLDGSELEIDASSQIELTRLQRTNDGGIARLISQLGGVTINRVSHLTGQSSYELQTPGVNALVRGTVFLGRVARDASSNRVTEEDIALEQGWVDVNADGQQTRLHPGQMVCMDRDLADAPGQPTEMEVEQGTVMTSYEAGQQGGGVSGPDNAPSHV